jgi:hypothetical protein
MNKNSSQVKSNPAVDGDELDVFEEVYCLTVGKKQVLNQKQLQVLVDGGRLNQDQMDEYLGQKSAVKSNSEQVNLDKPLVKRVIRMKCGVDTMKMRRLSRASNCLKRFMG